MNCVSSTSNVLSSPPAPDRAFAGVVALLGMTLRALRLHWHDHQRRRRELHALDAISEMNTHMLQDIGAPDQLISRAAAGRSAHHWRDVPFQLSVVLVAIAVLGTVTPASAAKTAHGQTASNAHSHGQPVGVFTGEFVAGTPVYRFPSVVVTGTRKAALAVKPTQPKQTRATTARSAA